MATNPNPYRPAQVRAFDTPAETPGFLREASTAWTLGWANQNMFRAEEYFLNPPEKGFNPWAHMKGYELYSESLINARSTSEIDAMKQRIDFNMREKDIQARGEYGLIAQFVGGLSDPANLVPIPISRGLGLLKGAAIGATANAAIAAVTDPMRIAADPTANWNELAYSIGGAALFGAALGGASGAIPLSRQDHVKGRAHFNKLVADLSDMEGANIARPFDASEENYKVISGHTGSIVDGRYEAVKIEVAEVSLREKKGADGNLYHYDDSFGWVLEADRGRPDPRPVAPEITEGLSVPDRTTENRMTVDEAALKADFEQGKHREARPGVETMGPDDIKSAREYVTFKQIEAVWRRRDPLKPGEDRAAYDGRIQKSALEELKASRASASVARRNALAPLLDKLNFSPVAKAIRVFSGDNIMGDLPLQLAGDYGWMIRANEFGYKTPPSLLLRAMRHNVAFNEIRQAIDSAWLKYVQKNANAKGTMVMGQNITAAAEAMKTTVGNMVGGKALSKRQFSQMAGRAVFDKDSFQIDGFDVVPEARDAAQAWTRVAQKYDKEARELGLFYDQSSLTRTSKVAAAKIADLESRMAAWLWGETGTPEKLTPAIRVKVTESDFKSPDAGIYDGFHGSKRGFTSFDKNKLGENTNAPSAKKGFFFSKSAETANTYTGAKNLVTGTSEVDALLAKHEQMLLDRNARAREFAKEIDAILVPAGGMFGDRFRIEDGVWNILDEGDPDTAHDWNNGLDEQEMLDAFGPEVMAQRAAYKEAMTRARQMIEAFNDMDTPEFKEFEEIDEMLFADFLDREPPPPGSSVHPVKLVMRNPYVHDQRGQEYRERKFSEIIETAKAGGHDSVIIKNTYDVGSGKNDILDDVYIVLDDSQIVSVFDQPGLEQAAQLGKKEVEQVFTGASHDEAIARALEAHPDLDRARMGLENHGFVRKSATGDVPKPKERKFTQVKPDPQDNFATDNQYFIDKEEVSPEEWANEKMAYEQELADYKVKAEAAARDGTRTFRQSDQLAQDRVESLTEGQRYHYDQWKDQLDRLARAKAEADARLQQMTDEPHGFRDQYGEPESFLARFWNHTAIGAEREKFKRLLTAWYRRDNPIGAPERADKTIDDMLKAADGDDEAPVGVPGLKHLNQRKLDMPNSFKVNDPELGEITASEFFNTDLEVVAEAYIRGMGHKIEAAKMFGDAGLWEKMEDIEDHWRERVLQPAVKKGASRAELMKLRETFDEYAGWVDLIKRGVLGGLKTNDPWSMTSRTARNLKNYQILTSMGRILLTSIPEAMRIPMVNGFKTAFSGLWVRSFGDHEKIRANLELSRETGEIYDLVREVHAARVAELNTPDPSGGGTYIEKLLERAVPGFFKLTGLAHWTVMAKDMTMFTAQHKVMDLARKLDQGNNAEKLAALGISKRDAKLLASMPVDQHGSLILPAVQNWTGADGKRARTLLIDAIHGEARRAIVTPSFADKSLLFSGLATRKGKVIYENDLMSIPLQFMSYGMAASQKVLMSGLQGRDQNFFMGALGMFMLGVFSNYLKQPQTATMNKSMTEWMIEGYESSGVGGFWFSDLNQMIERYSYNTIGLRPQLGADPRFGRTTGVGDMIDLAGPSVGTLADVIMAFTDPEKSASNRAQAIRRAVPYNNVIWWGFASRDVAGAVGRSFKE